MQLTSVSLQGISAMNGWWGSKRHNGQGGLMLWSKHVEETGAHSVGLLVPNEERQGIGRVQRKWNDERHSRKRQKHLMSSAEYDLMVWNDDAALGYWMQGST
jgi:hypothetical protein